MSSVSRTVSQAHCMSAAMALLKEFRLSGRFSVMVATLSATSNRMVSRSMHPPDGVVVEIKSILFVSASPVCGRGARPTASHRTKSTTDHPRPGRPPHRNYGEEHFVEIQGKKAVIV